MKKIVAFTLISFAVLKWGVCLSVQVPFELSVQILVQLLLELVANWRDQNVNELEFELSRMWMKQSNALWHDTVVPIDYNFWHYLNVVTLTIVWLLTWLGYDD